MGKGSAKSVRIIGTVRLERDHFRWKISRLDEVLSEFLRRETIKQFSDALANHLDCVLTRPVARASQIARTTRAAPLVSAAMRVVLLFQDDEDLVEPCRGRAGGKPRGPADRPHHAPRDYRRLRAAGYASTRRAASNARGSDLRRADHTISTEPGRARHDSPSPKGSDLIASLEEACGVFGIRYAQPDGPQHGIVHVIAPEFGFIAPGITLVCGDSHTCTLGAFGVLAFAVGATEIGWCCGIVRS